MSEFTLSLYISMSKINSTQKGGFYIVLIKNNFLW